MMLLLFFRRQRRENGLFYLFFGKSFFIFSTFSIFFSFLLRCLRNPCFLFLFFSKIIIKQGKLKIMMSVWFCFAAFEKVACYVFFVLLRQIIIKQGKWKIMMSVRFCFAAFQNSLRRTFNEVWSTKNTKIIRELCQNPYLTSWTPFSKGAKNCCLPCSADCLNFRSSKTASMMLLLFFRRQRRENELFYLFFGKPFLFFFSTFFFFFFFHFCFVPCFLFLFFSKIIIKQGKLKIMMSIWFCFAAFEIANWRHFCDSLNQNSKLFHMSRQ